MPFDQTTPQALNDLLSAAYLTVSGSDPAEDRAMCCAALLAEAVTISEDLMARQPRPAATRASRGDTRRSGHRWSHTQPVPRTGGQ